MIDALDKQTQPLPFEPAKRGRGRPKTGNAMTPAEKQRAYRERIKGNVTDNMHKGVAEDLRVQLQKAVSENERLEATIEDLVQQVRKLNVQLSSREGVTESEQKKSWRIQKRKTSKGRWVTVKGSYESEKAAHEALLEIPKEHPVGTAYYRVLELKDTAAGEL